MRTFVALYLGLATICAAGSASAVPTLTDWTAIDTTLETASSTVTDVSVDVAGGDILAGVSPVLALASTDMLGLVDTVVFGDPALYLFSLPASANLEPDQIDTEPPEFAVLFALVLVAGLFGWAISTLITGGVGLFPSRRRRAAAQKIKAIMYRDGEGRARNYEQAVTLFRKAAEAGDWSAQLNLGCMYGTGRGVPKDDVQCYAWWELAATSGSTRGQRGCEILARRMASEDLQHAKKLSNRLRARVRNGN